MTSPRPSWLVVTPTGSQPGWRRSSSAGRISGCVVIAAGLDAGRALELLLSGANAVLVQPHPRWLVRHAVAIAGSGGMFLDPWLAHEVADGLRPRRGNLRGVTGSEQRVLLAASRGLDVRAIAHGLDVSMDTVKGHLRSVQHRLGVGRKELIRTARAAGLLPAGNGRPSADTWDTTRGLTGLSVFVVSRERLARETLMGTLRAAGAQVVGQAADAQGVSGAGGAWRVTLALGHAADTGLLELKAARPEAGLAVVPWVLNTRTFHGALAARAQAIVGLDAHLDELIVGLRLAASGGLYFHTSALRVALKAVDQARAGAAGPLTGRQVDVLSLAARGMSNREIARSRPGRADRQGPCAQRPEAPRGRVTPGGSAARTGQGLARCRLVAARRRCRASRRPWDRPPRSLRPRGSARSSRIRGDPQHPPRGCTTDDGDLTVSDGSRRRCRAPARVRRGRVRGATPHGGAAG